MHKKKSIKEDILAGGGETGELLRSYDWSTTLLGSPDTWPQSLKTIVRIMLTSQQPIWTVWGEEQILFYNDAFKAILGSKHPRALGQTASLVWGDIWHVIEPRLKKAIHHNVGTYEESQLLMMERDSHLEETYHTISCSPVPDDHGGTGGIFCIHTDDTQRIIKERQSKLLKDLDSSSSNAQTFDEFYSLSLKSLESNPRDFPFALIYSMEQDKHAWKLLANTSGLHTDHQVVEEMVELSDPSGWPFQEVFSNSKAILVDDLQQRFYQLPTGAWNQPPRQAIMIPIPSPDKSSVLVLGLNPYRHFDQEYQVFVERIRDHISDRIMRMQALQQELQQLHELFEQAPAAIAVIEGPDQVYKLANPLYQQLSNRTQEQLLGKSVRQAFPEVEGQGIYELFDHVIQTGEAYIAHEFPIVFDRSGRNEFEQRYYNFQAQPMRDTHGEVSAVMILAFEVTEQVKAKQKVIESEEKYRNLFERMEQGFCILEMIFDASDKPLDYRFLEVNPAFEKHTGLKEAAGRTARELMPKLEEHWFEIYAKVALTGESIHFTQGSELMGRWFDVYAFRLGDSQSRKVALLFSDITQRKQGEEALKQSNEWFQLVNKATQDAIWDWDLITNKINWNESVRTLFNYKPEEVGKDATWWYEHVHPEDRQTVVESIHQVIDAGRVHWSKEYRFLTGDGGFKVVYDRGFVMHDTTGKPVRMIGSMQDITERKKAESAVKENEQLFRSFANNIQNLAWIADPEGWIYWYNQRWYAYTGTTHDEMQGWGWQKVHHPDHIQRVLAFVKNAWGKGKTWEITFPLRGADGQYRWFLTRAYAVKNAIGQVERWIGTNTDIHDQKMAEQQLHTLTQELAASNEELAAATEEIQANLEELSNKNKALSAINADMDNFIYTASHDLKAPISNIEGLLQMLHRSLHEEITNSAQLQKVFQLMSSSIERFKKTIKDLTQVAKVEKELDETTSLVNIAEVIKEVLLDLELTIEESQADIVTCLDRCTSITFSAKNIKSIVYNLVSNAIKYRHADRNPEITISCRQEPGFVVLAVKDNGLGMEKTEQDKIFAMFKRLHSHVDGTGIGLYIVKKMIDSAGGMIQVESEIGKGSTFSVYFRHQAN